MVDAFGGKIVRRRSRIHANDDTKRVYSVPKASRLLSSATDSLVDDLTLMTMVPILNTLVPVSSDSVGECCCNRSLPMMGYVASQT